jgi:UDP-N-acetylglucosamine/UDP-N-acetyl-alpha-D-glucosaminouronate 4-epimerase
LKAIVTGGAGFIGSNLVQALLERGHEVRVLDNLSTGRLANLAGIETDLELLEGDVRRLDQVQAATRGVELVFHQAALPSVPRSIEDPIGCAEVNVMGTLNVLIAARDQDVRRLVLASSSSIYGNGVAAPRRESQRPDPISPYAASKLAAERYAVSFGRLYPLETVSLRYFNVFGPRQDAQSQYAAVVPRFIAAVAAGEPVTVYGDGEQSRDFTYVADVVDANVLAADAPEVSGAVVNVAAGRSRTVGALADAVGHALDRPVEKRYLPARPGETRDSWADIGKARRLLGYEPRTALEEGLPLTIEAAVDGNVLY